MSVLYSTKHACDQDLPALAIDIHGNEQNLGANNDAVSDAAASSPVPTHPNAQQQDAVPFTDDELIAMTRAYLAAPSPDRWSAELVLRGPVIGPLAKPNLVDTLSAVSPNDSFTDLEPNAFGFCVDPVEKHRVWWMVRPRGVFSKPYQHPVMGEIAPTGARMIAPPQSQSARWDEEGKIEYLSVGYVTDRFTGDTTGGMGAVFGMMKHMGVDIDGSVGSLSMRVVQRLGSVLPGIPKSFSAEQDIPSWWTDKRRGADP